MNSRDKNEAPSATVSDIMVATLVNWGVFAVFGMVGHSNLGLAEAVRKRCETGEMRFFGIRHEGAAAFAASAFGKLTGRPAACLTIAGPGATNLLTGLWDAKLDRVPLLALTGQVDLQFLGPGSFQEVDLAAAFHAVCCFSQTVLPESNHAELAALALKNAIQKRDVAHLIFPNQVQDLPAPPGSVAFSPAGRLPETAVSPDPDSIEKAAALLRGAKKPALIMGYGSRGCAERVIAFAERFGLFVITTFKAKGLIPDLHPLACGVLGLSGTPVAGLAMNGADLLLVLGASFARHTGINRKKDIIQVDLDSQILGKFHPVTAPVWGDIATTLGLLQASLADLPPKPDPRPDIAARWADWRAEKEKRAAQNRGRGISSAAVFAAMSRHTPQNAVITVDVGNNTYSFGRYFECKAQSVLMSGYLGSIGYGYPAAMGAFAAAPERPIVAVTGDGGFAQYMAEVTTAVKYSMPIKHILLNNSELAKITKEQKAAGKPVWETALVNPDFARYAELCGATGIRVEEAGDLDSALSRAFSLPGPVTVEIITDPELV
ncbi:MAG: thiamine pyrophosphate-binding protein [Thermodesulfobacteriota bacterium]